MGGIAWTREEDSLLVNCIKQYGEGKWNRVPQLSGLKRCRKSCRLRWLNYLRPNIKRGKFSEDEVDLIIKLHKLLGNKWSLIAGRLPGRTANDVKNYWNHHLRKKLSPTDEMESSSKPISSSSPNDQIELIAPQERSNIKTSSSPLQHLLGFGPFLYGEGAQQPMVTHLDHDHNEVNVEDDDHDACFEECGKIYRQLFHDFHEIEDLDRGYDLDRAVEDRGIGKELGVEDHACMREQKGGVCFVNVRD